MTNRKDTWKPEEDSFLAQMVIQHIQNGSTQLKAFEEAATHLGRTSNACGFRFNSELRQQYKEELKNAKESRKTPREKTVETLHKNFNTPSFDVDETLSSLKNYITHLKSENERLTNELQQLHKKQQPIKVSEDLQYLLAILERARSAGLLQNFTTEREQSNPAV